MREPADFIEGLERLSSAAWVYAALGTALELGILDRLAGPLPEATVAELCDGDAGLAADLVEALVAVGAVQRDGAGTVVPTDSFQMLLSPSLAPVLRAEIRGDHLQTRALVRRAREGEPLTGWMLDDPLALTAQGETGSLTGMLVEALVPRLDGLEQRMRRPGARILDVGAGVGVIAAELCRLWPEAEAIGLEPHRTARELGRSRIAAAGLAGRIALRDERLEQLGERDGYDLAFLPQPFLSSAALAAGLPRVHRALRPGGWLILLTNDIPDDAGLIAAARAFRARIWGGGTVAPERLAEQLARVGFAPALVGHPVGSFRVVCARRPAVGAAAGQQALATSESE